MGELSPSTVRYGTVRYGTVWYGNPIGNRIGANPLNTFYCLVISAVATQLFSALASPLNTFYFVK